MDNEGMDYDAGRTIYNPPPPPTKKKWWPLVLCNSFSNEGGAKEQELQVPAFHMQLRISSLHMKTSKFRNTLHIFRSYAVCVTAPYQSEWFISFRGFT